MNNDHIYKWARASGIKLTYYSDSGLPYIDDKTVLKLKKFAERAAKYERQLCAKICDRQAQDKNEHQVWTDCAQNLAKRIRSRS